MGRDFAGHAARRQSGSGKACQAAGNSCRAPLGGGTRRGEGSAESRAVYRALTMTRAVSGMATSQNLSAPPGQPALGPGGRASQRPAARASARLTAAAVLSDRPWRGEAAMKITGSGPTAGAVQRRKVAGGGASSNASFAEQVGTRPAAARGLRPARRSSRWTASSPCRSCRTRPSSAVRPPAAATACWTSCTSSRSAWSKAGCSEGALRRLAGLADQLRPALADPDLDAVLDEIELRAAVEARSDPRPGVSAGDGGERTRLGAAGARRDQGRQPGGRSPARCPRSRWDWRRSRFAA